MYPCSPGASNMAEAAPDDDVTFAEALRYILQRPSVVPEEVPDVKPDEATIKQEREETDRKLTEAFAKLPRRRRRSSRLRKPRGPATLETWAMLPDILLEDIFSYLSWPQRLRCARVCRSWYYTFQSPRLWRHLTMKDTLFLRERYHPTKGRSLEISPFKVQKCVGFAGNFLNSVTIKPMTNFNSLYEFLHVLTTYLQWFEEYPCPLLESFHLTFACEIIVGSIGSIIGTGGQILQEIEAVLKNLRNIRSVALNQLRLDSLDSIDLLSGLLEYSPDTLEQLELTNCTKERYPMFQVGMFRNLRRLLISPPQINNDIVLGLSRHPVFEELVLIQDQYTPPVEPISSMTWLEVKDTRPDFKVRLEGRGHLKDDMMIQERAPVHGVVYNTPYFEVSPVQILRYSDEYVKSLRLYGHTHLPRKHGSRSFNERPDTSLVLLIRECPNIQTLIIRDRVSTTTLLIIATEAKNLRTLHVRRNAILKRFDWPRASHWTKEHYAWLKACSQSYDIVQKEISRILGYRWYMLSDQSFKALRI